MKKWSFIILIAAFAVGCGQPDFSKLEVGTSTEEVVEEYGEPDDKVEMVFGMELWRYSNNVLGVMNGKVTNVKLDTDSAEIILDEARKGMEDVEDALEELEKDFGVDVEASPEEE